MFSKTLLRLGDFVFVTRPLIIVPAWSFYFLGERAGSTSGMLAADAPYGLASMTTILMAAYLINLIFDQDTDRQNNKGHYLTREIFRVRTVVIMAFLYFVVASVAFQSSAPGQRPWLIATLVLSLIYSLPPLRLCARPIVDLAANALFYGCIALMVGFGGFSIPFRAGLVATVPYVFLVGATFLHTAILDIDGDGATGKRTTAVVLGAKASAWLAVGMAGVGLAFAVTNFVRHGNVFTLVVLSVSAPAFAFGAWKLSSTGSRARARVSSNVVQYATAVVAVAACIYRPWFAAVIVPLVVVSRLYYRARFGLNYPGPAEEPEI